MDDDRNIKKEHHLKTTMATIITTSSHGPVPLRPAEVPSDLTCVICLSIPLEPVLTPCEHLFCKDCLHQSLRTQPTCPVDRLPCFLDEIQEIRDGSLIYRIWSSVTVMCEEHNAGCSWTGSIADYVKHRQESCKRQHDIMSLESFQELQARLVKCEMEKEILRDEIIECQEERNRLKIKLSQCLKTQDLYIERLKMAESTRPAVPILFRAGSGSDAYKYDRNNVVELSQLISRYLENKPDEIDANRIFNCIRSCVVDLQKDWSDNPEHYYIDMRMLLATCSASTWFSPKQRQNFLNWMNEQEWV